MDFKVAPKLGNSPCTISNAVALLSRIHSTGLRPNFAKI